MHIYFPSIKTPRVALVVAGNTQYDVKMTVSMLLSIMFCHSSSSAVVEYAAVCPPPPPPLRLPFFTQVISVGPTLYTASHPPTHPPT